MRLPEVIMDIIKTVGSSGQISIGKKFAGQTVMLSELDNGVWLIKLGRFISDNEKWLHDPDVENTLNKALDWAEKNLPADTDFHDLENRTK
jgi:hypothetical protein